MAGVRPVAAVDGASRRRSTGRAGRPPTGTRRPSRLLPGIALLAAAGIGLVAVLVDLLAVRLRRAAPAGLPLLAVYSVPAAVRDGRRRAGWRSCSARAGFLGLLMADAREQARRVGARRAHPGAGSAPARRGRVGGRLGATALAAAAAIGSAAVAVAVLLPARCPASAARLLGLGGGAGTTAPRR